MHVTVVPKVFNLTKSIHVIKNEINFIKYILFLFLVIIVLVIVFF